MWSKFIRLLSCFLVSRLHKQKTSLKETRVVEIPEVLSCFRAMTLGICTVSLKVARSRPVQRIILSVTSLMFSDMLTGFSNNWKLGKESFRDYFLFFVLRQIVFLAFVFKNAALYIWKYSCFCILLSRFCLLPTS